MISMLSSLRRSLEISLEADELELQFGRCGAIESVCEKILQADRGERRRLYKLHDELGKWMTDNVTVVYDAFGFDITLIETVGVGQVDVADVRHADPLAEVPDGLRGISAAAQTGQTKPPGQRAETRARSHCSSVP